MGFLENILFGNFNPAGHASFAVPRSPNTAHGEDTLNKKEREAGRIPEGPDQHEDEEPIAQTVFDENHLFGIKNPRSSAFCILQAEPA